MEDLRVYEIRILPVAAASTAIVIDSALYNIESSNSIEVRSQSVSTDTGNEHTIVKTANESVIGTKIPAGELSIQDTSAANVRQNPAMLARVVFIGGIL